MPVRSSTPADIALAALSEKSPVRKDWREEKEWGEEGTCSRDSKYRVTE